MKIVLEAFQGKLKGVMEVPEDTGSRFKLLMDQPVQFFTHDMLNKSPMMADPITKMAYFEWNGLIYSQKDHPYDGARVYQLVSLD